MRSRSNPFGGTAFGYGVYGPAMDLRQFDTAIRVWVVVALLGGNVLIFLDTPLLTTVGVLLVIVGLVSVIPLVRTGLAEPAAG